MLQITILFFGQGVVSTTGTRVSSHQPLQQWPAATRVFSVVYNADVVGCEPK
jgi:hypothetical protein